MIENEISNKKKKIPPKTASTFAKLGSLNFKKKVAHCYSLNIYLSIDLKIRVFNENYINWLFSAEKYSTPLPPATTNKTLTDKVSLILLS